MKRIVFIVVLVSVIALSSCIENDILASAREIGEFTVSRDAAIFMSPGSYQIGFVSYEAGYASVSIYGNATISGDTSFMFDEDGEQWAELVVSGAVGDIITITTEMVSVSYAYGTDPPVEKYTLYIEVN